MRGGEAPQRAQPSSAMALLPASAFGGLCLRNATRQGYLGVPLQDRELVDRRLALAGL